MPAWIGWVFAAIFFVPGAFLFLFGVKGLFDGVRIKRMRERHPNEPWRAEYAWDPDGISADSRASVLSQVFKVGFLVLFLSPFNYLVFVGLDAPSVPLVPRGLVAFFDLVTVFVLWGLLATLWRANKYGRARLVFGSFPFYLGGPLSARLRTRRPISEFKKMSLTLPLCRGTDASLPHPKDRQGGRDHLRPDGPTPSSSTSRARSTTASSRCRQAPRRGLRQPVRRAPRPSKPDRPGRDLLLRSWAPAFLARRVEAAGASRRLPQAGFVEASEPEIQILCRAGGSLQQRGSHANEKIADLERSQRREQPAQRL